MTTVNETKVKIDGSWLPLVPYATTSSKGIVQVGEGLAINNGVLSSDGGRTSIIPVLSQTALGQVGTCQLQPSSWGTTTGSKSYTFTNTSSYNLLDTFTFNVINYEYSSMPDYYKLSPSFEGLTDISNATITFTIAATSGVAAQSWQGKLVNETTGEILVESTNRSRITTTVTINATNLDNVYKLYGYNTGSSSYSATITLTCPTMALYATIPTE